MSSVNFQFHADPDELVRVLLPAWLEGVDAHLVAEESRAETRGQWVRTRFELGDVPRWQGSASIRRILVRTSPFGDHGQEEEVFLQANPGLLVVQPGYMKDSTLEESRMSSGADEPEIGTWRKVVRRARRDLSSGAVLINPFGERFEKPAHRFSDGALALSERGVEMLSFGGGVRYELLRSRTGSSAI